MGKSGTGKGVVIVASLSMGALIAYIIAHKMILKKKERLVRDAIFGFGGAVNEATLEAVDGNHPAYSHDYYKNNKPKLTEAQANSFADKLYNAKGYFDDDEDAVYGAYKSMPTWADMSLVADKFYQRHNKNLYTYLEFLSSGEMMRLNSIILSKPKK